MEKHDGMSMEEEEGVAMAGRSCIGEFVSFRKPLTLHIVSNYCLSRAS
jgi:hypothetical protein